MLSVQVFFGGTAGIGAALALKYATHSKDPTIHLVGRNVQAADELISRMRDMNPTGTYAFHS